MRHTQATWPPHIAICTAALAVVASCVLMLSSGWGLHNLEDVLSAAIHILLMGCAWVSLGGVLGMVCSGIISSVMNRGRATAAVTRLGRPMWSSSAAGVLALISILVLSQGPSSPLWETLGGLMLLDAGVMLGLKVVVLSLGGMSLAFLLLVLKNTALRRDLIIRRPVSTGRTVSALAFYDVALARRIGAAHACRVAERC